MLMRMWHASMYQSYQPMNITAFISIIDSEYVVCELLRLLCRHTYILVYLVHLQQQDLSQRGAIVVGQPLSIVCMYVCICIYIETYQRSLHACVRYLSESSLVRFLQIAVEIYQHALLGTSCQLSGVADDVVIQ
jgi:hypothetical protein